MKRIIWTEEKVKLGFDRFIAEHGRLPWVHEIDTASYLPSSRLLQKKFNGLEKLREKLGFSDTHFGKGEHRSIIAHQVNIMRVDFYVYCPEGNFAVDIFHSSTLNTLQSNVNIKVSKYTNHTVKLYLVSANTNISQDSLDVYLKARNKSLPSNICLLSMIKFISLIKDMKVYCNPILK